MQKHLIPMALLALSCAACSPGRAQPAAGASQGPWSAEIAQAQNQAVDDLTKQILADGVVTDAEMQESYDAFVKCAAGQGVSVSLTYRQGRVSGYSAPRGHDDVLDACARGRVMVVSGLYNEMRLNPQHEDPNEVLARCLRSNGLAPTISAQELKEQMDRGQLKINTDDPRFADCVS